MAALSFPSPTQLKNISGPTDGSDAATKTYVDTQLSSGSATVSAAGSNTYIQYNNAGALGANSNFVFNSATSLLTLTGNASITGNISATYFIGNGSQLTGVDLLTVGNADIANRIANGTSNIDTPVSSGNITVGIGGVKG